MATYQKPIMTVMGVTLMGFPLALTSAYGVDQVQIKGALKAFEAKRTIEVKTEGGTLLVPYHAVKGMTYSYASVETTKADAYCE